MELILILVFYAIGVFCGYQLYRFAGKECDIIMSKIFKRG